MAFGVNLITTNNMFLLQYAYLYFIGEPQNIVVYCDLEMMQGATIHPSGNQSGPTFGCLFVGGTLVEEDFGNCLLVFACDRLYQADTRRNHFGDHHRVGRKR